MALRYSFDMGKEADLIDQAISATLAKGLRTADIKSDGCTVISTRQMGDAILGIVCSDLGGQAPNYVAVRNVSGRRRWSKLSEWLASKTLLISTT